MITTRRAVVSVTVLAVAAAWIALAVSRRPGPGLDLPGRAESLQALNWPDGGQAALQVGAGTGHPTRLASPGSAPAPIASVAKVMTALVVLRAHPLDGDEDGPELTIDEQASADTSRRAQQDESVVAVQVGETLTERQALGALLVPSANNIAALLARWCSGDEASFVADMNRTAAQLHLRDTHYTDPSGFDPDTVSTAADQVVLFAAAMAIPAFAHIAGLTHVELPVAGNVEGTAVVYGRAGVTAGKTGSHDAAGSCFVFRSEVSVATAAGAPARRITIIGAVLGQPLGRDAAPAQYAAVQLVGQVVSGLAADGRSAAGVSTGGRSTGG